MMNLPDGAIAIIGMSGRFPGASNLDQFWKNVREGVRAISPLPQSSASILANHARVGAGLTDVDRFDALFFGISGREAEIMDPQRRIFLECAWEALENAGVDPWSYRGAVGVYAGASASSYLPLHLDFAHPAQSFGVLLGNDKDYIASYLGYKFNLRGPCVGVQTACSTSLVAVHLACASLLARECDVAISGGTTVRFPQNAGYVYEKDFILSPDGRCRTFDANANGTVFANGVGVVVLKRLEDALRDGDPIRAVIRGTAVNNDGSLKVGFTAPSVIGQMEVITEALAISGVDPTTIQYIEAHGTATPLGDAIEIEALKQAFDTASLPRRSIALGALKAAIGHTEAAAGIAGLIKTVLALENGCIPPHADFDQPNPELKLHESPFYVCREAREWLSNKEPRRAGVSSFGIGGTNAHVIVEEASIRKEEPFREASSYVLPLSGKTTAALVALAKSYQEWLSNHEGPLHHVAYTASHRRSQMERRLSVVGANKAEIATALGAFAAGETPPGIVTGKAGQTAPKVIFVFPGQGSQWVGMGRQLYREESVFRDALHSCDEAIRKEAGFSVIEELNNPEETSRLSEIDVVQPVLFAIEVALAALWRAWGVEPAAVIGHSMGEVAAAFVAGALSMRDAVAIICRRSCLLRRMSGRGAMALVELPLPNVEKVLVGYEDRLSVAVSNGPRSTVIAGDPATLDEVLGKLEHDGVFCRRVKVDVASHSPQMDSLREELVTALAGISPNDAKIEMRSTVTGERVHGRELLATYWVNNLRKPVLFSKVVAQWIAEGHTIFVEMSPHPILKPSVEENLCEANADGLALASTRRDQDERQSMLSSLGALFTRGVPIAWKSFYPNGGRVVSLPTYPWQRERYWIDTTIHGKSLSTPNLHASDYALLGIFISPSTHSNERIWQQSLSVSAIPWLAEHRVQDAVVFPGAGYVEYVLEVAKASFGAQQIVLEDVAFEQMLTLSENQTRDVQVVLIDEGERSAFRISSRAGSTAWTQHASGYLRSSSDDIGQTIQPPRVIATRLSHEMDIAAYYQGIRDRQIYHGPPFQGIVELRAGEHEALAKIRLPEDVPDDRYVLHPALLDACLQVSGAVGALSGNTGTYVPVGISHLHLHQRPRREVWVLATKSPQSQSARDLRIVDENGRVLLAMDGLSMQQLDRVSPSADPLAHCVYDVGWREAKPLAHPTFAKRGTWLVFVDRTGLANVLAERFSRLGQRCIRVLPGLSYDHVSPDEIRINPAKPDDYRRIFKETFGEQGHCEGIVHLSSLDATPFEQTTTKSLTEALAHACVSATYLAQAVVRHGFRNAPRLFLITRGAQSVQASDPVSVSQAPILGLGKTIAMEHPELRCTRIDLPSETADTDIDLLWRELAGTDREDLIALRAQTRYVARLAEGKFQRDDEFDGAMEPARNRPYRLEIRKPGVLERLALYEVELPQPGPEEVLIEVEAAGLNFLDVLAAIGALPPEATGADQYGPTLGGECAGTVIAVGAGVTDVAIGKAVMALGTRAMGTHAIAHRALVAEKPASTNWHEAATLPIVFLTAYYALEYVGRLRKGERVLIHAGAGGVGLAAIQWAQHVGAEVFATAGSEEKRGYLRNLGVAHVFDSRSLSFVEDIKRCTGGDGVDVVLNSLAGEFIPASLSLLRDYGRFLEIGKRDYYENNQIGLRPFLRNLTFSLVDLRGILLQRPAFAGSLLREVVQMFDRHDLRALPVKSFPVQHAVEAFQFMAQAKHIGKIALAMKDADAQIVPRAEQRKIAVRPDRTYLLTGGLGGLGLSLAQWLVEQGARSLVLVGRKGPSAQARVAIQSMEQAGARVHCAQADVSRESDVEQLFAMVRREMPPLAGIVHAAMVLDDHTLLEQSQESFARVYAPKALGAWNLHKNSTNEVLDFFVMYSSSTALTGSPGQANYCASNAYLDALCRERVRLGLPGMSIQWGGFAEVGAAAALDIRGHRLSHRGMMSFSPAEGLDAFRRLLDHPRAEVGILRFDPRQWVEFYPSMAGVPFFAEVMKQDAGLVKHSSHAKEILARLQAARPDERLSMLEKHLAEQAGMVLRLEPSRIDRKTALQELGMDSLMSLELRNRIEASLGERLSATVIFTYSSVAALARHMLERLKLASTMEQISLVNPPKVETSLPVRENLAETTDDDAVFALFDDVVKVAEEF